MSSVGDDVVGEAFIVKFQLSGAGEIVGAAGQCTVRVVEVRVLTGIGHVAAEIVVEDRAGRICDCGACFVEEDSTANIVKAPGRKVWGVLYEIPNDFIRGPRNDGRKTLKQIEGKRYCEITLRVRRLDGEKRDAATFVVREKFQEEGLKTSAEYVSHIVQGLREQGVSNEYIREVKRISAENNTGIGQAVDAL